MLLFEAAMSRRLELEKVHNLAWFGLGKAYSESLEELWPEPGL